MRKKEIVSLLIGTMFLTGCIVDYDYYFLHTIQNNSDIDIFSYQAANNNYAPTVYPDTLLPEAYSSWYGYGDTNSDPSDTLGIIPPNTFGYDWCLPFDYPRWFFDRGRFDKYFPAGYYSVFILSLDAYKEKGWDGIRNDYDILVRYDLTFDDLKALKDTIPFPPTEKMKDMKMYPPYEEVVSALPLERKNKQ